MTLEISVHRSMLLRILKDIYSDPQLGPILGFKGGTAAYLFYDLSRFSVDLDFDLLAPEQQAIVFEKVKKIVQEYGNIVEERQKRYNLLFILSYYKKIEQGYNIKIEINLRNFGSRYEIKSYLGIPMKVMIREDMFANKLVALYEREGKTNRDIYDVWFFLKDNWPLNETIIEKRTGLTMQVFLAKCIELLEAKSDRGILSGVGELLDEKQKRWAKATLRSETIFLLRLLDESIKKK